MLYRVPGISTEPNVNSNSMADQEKDHYDNVVHIKTLALPIHYHTSIDVSTEDRMKAQERIEKEAEDKEVIFTFLYTVKLFLFDDRNLNMERTAIGSQSQIRLTYSFIIRQ